MKKMINFKLTLLKSCLKLKEFAKLKIKEWATVPPQEKKRMTSV